MYYQQFLNCSFGQIIIEKFFFKVIIKLSWTFGVQIVLFKIKWITFDNKKIKDYLSFCL